MKKILERFKWFCTTVAIATVSVVAVGELWNESVGNTIGEIGTCIFGTLTICAALYWVCYCLDKISKKDKKKEAE